MTLRMRIQLGGYAEALIRREGCAAAGLVADASWSALHRRHLLPGKPISYATAAKAGQLRC